MSNVASHSASPTVCPNSPMPLVDEKLPSSADSNGIIVPAKQPSGNPAVSLVCSRESQTTSCDIDDYLACQALVQQLTQTSIEELMADWENIANKFHNLAVDPAALTLPSFSQIISSLHNTKESSACKYEAFFELVNYATSQLKTPPLDANEPAEHTNAEFPSISALLRDKNEGTVLLDVCNSNTALHKRQAMRTKPSKISSKKSKKHVVDGQMSKKTNSNSKKSSSKSKSKKMPLPPKLDAKRKRKAALAWKRAIVENAQIVFEDDLLMQETDAISQIYPESIAIHTNAVKDSERQQEHNSATKKQSLVPMVTEIPIVDELLDAQLINDELDKRLLEGPQCIPMVEDFGTLMAVEDNGYDAMAEDNECAAMAEDNGCSLMIEEPQCNAMVENASNVIVEEPQCNVIVEESQSNLIPTQSCNATSTQSNNATSMRSKNAVLTQPNNAILMRSSNSMPTQLHSRILQEAPSTNPQNSTLECAPLSVKTCTSCLTTNTKRWRKFHGMLLCAPCSMFLKTWGALPRRRSLTIDCPMLNGSIQKRSRAASDPEEDCPRPAKRRKHPKRIRPPKPVWSEQAIYFEMVWKKNSRRHSPLNPELLARLSAKHAPPMMQPTDCTTVEDEPSQSVPMEIVECCPANDNFVMTDNPNSNDNPKVSDNFMIIDNLNVNDNFITTDNPKMKSNFSKNESLHANCFPLNIPTTCDFVVAKSPLMGKFLTGFVRGYVWNNGSVVFSVQPACYKNSQPIAGPAGLDDFILFPCEAQNNYQINASDIIQVMPTNIPCKCMF